MCPVVYQVRAEPLQAIAARHQAIGPQVRPPGQPGASREAPSYALLDKPLHRKAAVVSRRLRVQRAARVARVNAARQVDDLQVGVAGTHDGHDVAQVVLQPGCVGREGVVLPGDGLFEPRSLHLVGGHAC